MKLIQSVAEYIKPLARKVLKAEKDNIKRNLKNVTLPPTRSMSIKFNDSPGLDLKFDARRLRGNVIKPTAASERKSDIIMKRLRGKAPKGKNKIARRGAKGDLTGETKNMVENLVARRT